MSGAPFNIVTGAFGFSGKCIGRRLQAPEGAPRNARVGMRSNRCYSPGGKMLLISPRSRMQTIALLLFVIVGAAMARGSFTIEQVLSSPFPTELIASPAGNRVAWVFDARGLRNIWVAEPGAGGSYRSRQVTPYTQDDGQDVGEVAWTPDGQSIVYCQGASERGPWELFIIPAQGGSPRQLTQGGSDMNPDWR